MPEITTLTLNHKELVEAIIKQQGIHDGIWQLYVEFGISATNISFGEDQLLPSAIVPIKKIGLHKVEAENLLSVDASKINPK
jgi:hypothetical protein